MYYNMPSPTYTIEYKNGDFFYNTVDTEQNTPLLATFPFTKETVMKWANDVAKPEPAITSIDSIFDPKISAIILKDNLLRIDSIIETQLFSLKYLITKVNISPICYIKNTVKTFL